ncbi:MAG: molybdenum ABC transporter ATP-binding protein [Pelagibacterales bacterium]|nr:molybdenum ABC transporter ATP-binding protein [Pelagibacterales bacterium]PPR15633.1 MAG: Molybdenum import ATP-binding protein ModC [Alphaproteobacteria bacterium MarineAlpha9_Bin3]|tara:strand:- start:4356 stop:5441 length:1086 start_codon:yes stop_codon:yes gene_type:complete
MNISNHIKYKTILGDFTSNININFSEANIIAITGLSGSGKSTIAKVICGLIKPQNGHIKINNKLLYCSRNNINIPPHKRNIGMVFQEARLFSHMSVKANLLYGQRRNSIFDQKRFDKIIKILGIKSILNRDIFNLSGGEAQRVSIGRALLSEPKILILDEPLTGLDSLRQKKIMKIIKDINKNLDIPILFISHSLEEIIFIAEKIIIIDKGKVAAQGSIDQIISYKKLSYFNSSNTNYSLIKGIIHSHDKTNANTIIDVNGIKLITKPISDKINSNQIIKLFSKDISIATKVPNNISINNILEVKITKIKIYKKDGKAEIILALGKQEIIAEITLFSFNKLKLKTNLKVYALIKAISIVGK